MSEFLIKKRLSLKFLGEGWDAAYINFTPVTMDEVFELADLEGKVDKNDSTPGIKAAKAVFACGRKMLREHFIDGKGYGGERDAEGKPVLKSINVDAACGELFTEIYVDFIGLIKGNAGNENL